MLPVPVTLSSADLEVLVPEMVVVWGLKPGEATNIPLNWELRILPGHFGLLTPLSQQAKKGIIVLGADRSRLQRGNWIASSRGGK